MAGPRQRLVGVEHADLGRCAAFGDDQIGARGTGGAALLGHHETREFFRRRDGRRKADAGEAKRKTKEPREAEREEVAALRSDERMQLVEDHAPERAEEKRRIGGGEKQRQLLRRGKQNFRRIAALARALRGRRVAGARLDADPQSHLGDRCFQVARDIDGERLERRDVEGVQAFTLSPRAGRGWRGPKVRAG